jgi:hypothetical protein
MRRLSAIRAPSIVITFPLARVCGVAMQARSAWRPGNSATHDRLIRELADGARAAVAFVEYDRSPEAQHRVASEQAYATAQWITKNGPAKASTPVASPSPATPSDCASS